MMDDGWDGEADFMEVCVTNTPVLETERLILRRFTEEDMEALRCPMEELVDLCSRQDGQSYSLLPAPMRCWSLTDENGSLAAFGAGSALEEGMWECQAFTRPDLRRRGYFFRILEMMAEDELLQDCDICFWTDSRWNGAAEALAAAGAERVMEEHLMEIPLMEGEPDGRGSDGRDSDRRGTDRTAGCGRLALEICEDDSGDLAVRAYTEDRVMAGECFLNRGSDSLCLYDLEVPEALRGQGMGTAFMESLMPVLADEGYKRLRLQVSGTNLPAMALYKKTGFLIKETLFCWLY